MSRTDLDKLLGYLNLSSGGADPQFARQLNAAFGALERQPDPTPAWQRLGSQLSKTLASMTGASGAFASTEQAAAVIRLVFDRLLPAYRRFHRDLLAHQSDEDLFRPFFLAKACQAVIRQEPPWEEDERIVDGAIRALNDFIGHRPVAVLRTEQKIEPYPHEWVCPIALYLDGAGVAAGRYHDLVTAALEVLRRTDRGVLDRACFDPDLLGELALDPRAYDFDHPVHKRPNYHFGQWDPHTIDNSGRYRRFALQAVTVDALLARVDEAPGNSRAELLAEAAAVLAGTMLMASGLSGSGPDTYDSGTTLTTLLPRIAAYRDKFYASLVETMPGAHGERLRSEAGQLKQPFGAARQDLNARLARLRAFQLQQVHLARLFAAMGNLEASSRRATVVAVASARMLSEIDGRITIGRLATEQGNVAAAAQRLAEVDDLLDRAIQCGAMVDPWNILGFQGQFSLFPAMENSVRDHRVDVLVHIVARLLGLYVLAAAEAAAAGEQDVLDDLLARLARQAQWWDRFATLDVSGVHSISGRESVDAAMAVAEALAAWRGAGESAGDIAFWRQHVGAFQSPKAYALVIATLLANRDSSASMALLIAWLSEAEQVPLAEGEDSFHRLAVAWLAAVTGADESRADVAVPAPPSLASPGALATRLFDYIEANAGELWEPPRAAWESIADDALATDSDEEDPFQAAYEGVTYRDSTDDGNQGETLEEGEAASDYELDLEAARLRTHLAFVGTISHLRQLAAASATRPEHGQAAETTGAGGVPAATLAAQLPHAQRVARGLAQLLLAVHRFRIPQPSAAHASMIEYDRRQRVKEGLLADVVAAAVEAARAVRLLRAASADEQPQPHAPPDEPATASGPRAEALATPVLRAILQRDREAARRAFPALREELAAQPILYVPLARGGDPAQLLATQSTKQLLVDLFQALPRLGLLAESCQLIAVAAAMERNRPKGDRAITEFDRLFAVGYRALVEGIVDCAEGWGGRGRKRGDDATTDADLVECLQLATEPLLRRWLEHSRSVRLSTLERLADAERWNEIVDFIGAYGGDLFTQRFMNLGNLRAIADQGADAWLKALADEADADELPRLIGELDRRIPRSAAAERLQTIVEAIIENHGAYKDFNTTTTQSDRGEMLYTLLDFLRLKASYGRVCWNIRPVVAAHEILMRRGRLAAAELWRRALAERTSDAADWHLARLVELTEKYRMRLASVADHLAERFVRPLAVDRLRALVAPAIRDQRAGKSGGAFALLEQEIAEFAEQPTGSGLEVPAWLAALEEEAARAQAGDGDNGEEAISLAQRLPPARLPVADVLRQLREWEGPRGE
ncbi:MAG: hypothetical protein HYX69_17555 [Planctomycetia bacterium]|nr:hypothetical protein [Planctomycetia bacterium]